LAFEWRGSGAQVRLAFEWRFINSKITITIFSSVGKLCERDDDFHLHMTVLTLSQTIIIGEYTFTI